MVMQINTNVIRIAEEIYQIKNYFTEDAFDLLYADVSLKIIECEKNETSSYQDIDYESYPEYKNDNSTKTTVKVPSGSVNFIDPYKTEFLNKTRENLSSIYKTAVYEEKDASVVIFFPGEGIRTHWDGSVDVPTYAGHPHRDYSSVFYFNEDFEGGLLHFTKLDIKIKPEPNMILLFPTTILYSHRVEEVTSGIRMMSPSFWCSDKKDRNI
jgi:hypothetical protein